MKNEQVLDKKLIIYPLKEDEFVIIPQIHKIIFDPSNKNQLLKEIQNNKILTSIAFDKDKPDICYYLCNPYSERKKKIFFFRFIYE